MGTESLKFCMNILIITIMVEYDSGDDVIQDYNNDGVISSCI